MAAVGAATRATEAAEATLEEAAAAAPKAAAKQQHVFSTIEQHIDGILMDPLRLQ